MTNPVPAGQQTSQPRGAAATAAPSTPTGGPGTAAPGSALATSPATSTTTKAADHAPVSGRNTPRLLAQLRGAVIVTSLLFAVLCLVGTALPYGSLSGARADIEQGQRLRVAQAGLARAQALAAEAADPRTNGDVAAFTAQADAVTAQLVAAAAAIPADADQVATVASQVGAYRGAVAVALAQRTGTDASKAQAGVAAANAAVSTTAGAGLSALTNAADTRLPNRFSTTFVPLIVAAAIVALLTAVAAATLLALRTRRVINLGLTGAVLALLLALGLAFTAAASVTGAANVTDGLVLAQARTAVEVQTAAEQARTAQLAGTANGKGWSELSTTVRKQLELMGSGSASAAWLRAETAQSKGDLAGTRTAIDAMTAAAAAEAASNSAVAVGAVAFDKVLAYGISASALALVAAALASWGLTQRLNEYR